MQDAFEKILVTDGVIWSFFNNDFYIREVSQCLLIFSVYPGLYRKDICLIGSGKVILDETIKRIRVTFLRFFFTLV